MHPLDRPVWTSLNTVHAVLSEGNALARRYLTDVNVFASARDDSSAAIDALGALVLPGQRVYVMQVPEIVVPAGLVTTKEAKGVQMIASAHATFEAATDELTELGAADAPEMLSLAKLTEPGPFLERTHVMGAFLGVRIGGRLVAMAGERLRFHGHTEVSGVCTHPEFRGRGLARSLSAAVAARIAARGDQPFLHAWKTNRAAIALYEGLGFRVRAEVNVAELTRTADRT